MKKHRIVTKPEQIIGGQSFIKVMLYKGKLSLTINRSLGVPFIEKLSNGSTLGWFVYFGGKSNHYQKSLDDLNVLPNNYNDHSLWRYDTKTFTYLQELSNMGVYGVREYLSVLAHHKRGESHRKGERSEQEFVLNDRFSIFDSCDEDFHGAYHTPETIRDQKEGFDFFRSG